MIDIARVGSVGAQITRAQQDGFGAEFAPMEEAVRQALIRRLFTEGIDNSTHTEKALQVAVTLLRTVVLRASHPVKQAPVRRDPPGWVAELVGASQPAEQEFAAVSVA